MKLFFLFKEKILFSCTSNSTGLCCIPLNKKSYNLTYKNNGLSVN